MDWVLVLGYVKALAWPVTVGCVVLGFRTQIASKIKDITEITTPVGGAKMNRKAQEVAEEAEAAATRQDLKASPPEPGQSAGPETGPDVEPTLGPTPMPPEAPRTSNDSTVDEPGGGDLADQQMEYTIRQRDEARAGERAVYVSGPSEASVPDILPNFDPALDLASAAPRASVVTAYAELDRVTRAAWTATYMEPASERQTVPTMVWDLRAEMDHEFPRIARELTDLRNATAHGRREISTEGALDFILACDRLAEVVVRHVSSSSRKRRSKKDLVTSIARLLDVRDPGIGVGSTVPKVFLDEICRRLEVDSSGSIAQQAQRIVTAADLPYRADVFDGRGTLAGGGSTLTLAALEQIEAAVRRMLAGPQDTTG